MVHACEVANRAEKEVAICRASGLNELFEAVLQKETRKAGSDATDMDQHSGHVQRHKESDMIDLTVDSAIQEYEDLHDAVVQKDKTHDRSGTAQKKKDIFLQSGPDASHAAGHRMIKSNPAVISLKKIIKDIVVDTVAASKKWTWGVELTRMI